MKAIVCPKYGSPDVLELREVDRPVIGEDEVLVRVHAASVNSWDWDLLTGTPFVNRVGALRRPKFNVLGADVAGRVQAVGRRVARFQTGDEVFGDVSGCGWGSFAEYVSASADALVIKPSDMTFEDAAAVPQAAVLALQGLRHGGPIEAGQSVLINGAGGGVGTFAVQIAKALRAEVTGVDSSPKLDTLRSIGADHVVDYTQEDFTKTGQRYDLILDVVAQRSVFAYRRALKSGGMCVIVGGTTAAVLQAVLFGKLLSILGGRETGLLLHKPSADDLEHLKELLAAEKIRPVIDRRYSLAKVPEALRYFRAGHAKGKVVIAVHQEG